MLLLTSMAIAASIMFREENDVVYSCDFSKNS